MRDGDTLVRDGDGDITSEGWGHAGEGRGCAGGLRTAVVCKLVGQSHLHWVWGLC